MRTRLAVLIAVVLAAGCTSIPTGGQSDGGVSVTQNDGLAVSLRPASATFGPGDDVRLELVLENTGEAAADVTGVSWGGAQFLTVDGCGQDRTSGAIPELAPVDRQAGTRGDRISVLRTCPHPSGIGLESGGTDTFPATASVTYTYTTVATGSVTVVPEDPAGGNARMAVTAGPVQARVTAPAETTGGSVRIPVTVTNTGDGEVVGGTVTVSAEPGSFSCPDAQLIAGERSIECTLDAGTVAADSVVRLRLELSYGYTEDVETGVRLRG